MRNRYGSRTLIGVLACATALVLGGTMPAGAATAEAQARRATTARPVGAGHGIASLSLDDGKMSQYRYARPVLRAAGVKATYYIISDGLTWGTKSYMSATEVRTLAAEGNEIGNHTKTHPKLTKLSARQVQSELLDSNRVITRKVGIRPTTCAYPHGSSNGSVRSVAAKAFTTCRGTGGGTNASGKLQRYDLRVFYVTTSTTAAQVRDAAASAKAKGVWIIFVWHGIGDVKSEDDVTAKAFKSQIRAIRSTGIAVQPVAKAFRAVA